MIVAERIKQLPANLTERSLFSVCGGKLVLTRIVYDEHLEPCVRDVWPIYSDMPVTPDRLETWIKEGAL